MCHRWLIGATLGISEAIICTIFRDEKSIDDGVTSVGSTINEFVHHHGISSLLHQLK